MHNIWRGSRTSSLFRPLPSGATPHRRAGGKEGQAIVEFALALPFLLILLVGLLEIGLLLRSHLSVMYAVREGARVGAAAASARYEWIADSQMLDAVNSNSNAEIQNIYFSQIYQGMYDAAYTDTSGNTNWPSYANTPGTYYCYSYNRPIVPYWRDANNATHCSGSGQWVYNYYPGARAVDSFLNARGSVTHFDGTPETCKLAAVDSTATKFLFETTDLYNRNYNGMCRPPYGPGQSNQAPGGVATCDPQPIAQETNPTCHNLSYTVASGKPGGLNADTGSAAAGVYQEYHNWTGLPKSQDPNGGIRCWTSTCTPGVAVMGIHIRYYHGWVTTFLGFKGSDFDDYATMRIQPPDTSRVR